MFWRVPLECGGGGSGCPAASSHHPCICLHGAWWAPQGFGKCVGRIVGGKAVGRMLCAGAGQQSVLQNNLGAWRYLGVRPGFFHLHKRPPAQAHTVGPAALNSAPKPNKLALKSVSTILCPCSEGMINPVSETELSLWDREVEDST